MRALAALLLLALWVGAQDRSQGVEAIRTAWAHSDEGSSGEKVRARAEFLDLFERADWDTFDAERERDLVRQGLWRTGRRALDRGDGALAKRAFEAYAARFPDSSEAKGLFVSKALLLLGKPDEACARLAGALKEEKDAARRAKMLVALGDARLLGGDVQGAKSAWLDAVTTPYGDGARGPVEDAKREALVRGGYLGQVAPSLDAIDAIGGDAPTWEGLKGNVVVVQAFSAGCNSCRGKMPSLRALRERYPGGDLVVLGLTVVEDEGFLPEQDTPEPFWVGERVHGIAPEDFRAHLEEIRKRIRINYPWLVQNLPQAVPWNALDPHPIVVVGRDRRIAFAQVGGEDFSTVHAILAKLLAAK